MSALLTSEPTVGVPRRRPAPAPDRPARAVDPDRDRHRHTGRCWWDVDNARFTCGPYPAQADQRRDGPTVGS